MPIVEYSDGTKIEFSAAPTQQDVEDAYNQAKGIAKPISTSFQDNQPTDYATRVTQANQATYKQTGQDIKSAIEGTGQYAGETPIRRGVEAVASASSVPLKVAYNFLPQFAQDYLQGVGQRFDEAKQKTFDSTDNPIGAFVNNPAVQKWTQDHPVAFKALNEILGTASAGGDIAGNILAVEGAVKGVQKGVDLTKTAVNKTKTAISDTKNLVVNKIAGKTGEEIIATPQADVPKLNPEQQKLWYKNQADILKTQATQAEQAAKVASEQSLTQTKDQINQFQQELGQVNRDTAISLKKPAQQLMRDSSQQYLSLTGEAADGSPALNKKIGSDTLSAAIDSKFEYNPEIAVSLKNDLGITETTPKTVIDPATKLPVIEANAPQVKTLTNQEILNKARGIMQEVSNSAKAGNKVYTAAEYQAMQKYSFLMEQLGNNGVDMTAANDFWKSWARTRDRIVREIKPFDETNIGKMPITTTLQRAEASANTAQQAAAKLDAQNFIKELETRMKVPEGSIGEKTRGLVQKSEAAKFTKATIEKAQTEILAKIKADKATALKTMSLKQYNTLRTANGYARINKFIKRTLIGLGIWGAAKATGLDKALLGLANRVI